MPVLSKLWSYVALAGLFIISIVSFGAYNQKIATTRTRLKETKKIIKAHEKELKRHAKNTEIEENIARMPDADIDAGLRDYYRDDSDV